MQKHANVKRTELILHKRNLNTAWLYVWFSQLFILSGMKQKAEGKNKFLFQSLQFHFYLHFPLFSHRSSSFPISPVHYLASSRYPSSSKTVLLATIISYLQAHFKSQNWDVLELSKITWKMILHLSSMWCEPLKFCVSFNICKYFYNTSYQSSAVQYLSSLFSQKLHIYHKKWNPIPVLLNWVEQLDSEIQRILRN